MGWVEKFIKNQRSKTELRHADWRGREGGKVSGQCRHKKTRSQKQITPIIVIISEWAQ